MNERKYVIAVRRDKQAQVPADWQQLLAGIPGVSVEGATKNRVQFSAGAETIQQVKSLLGECCLIEEAATRGPL